MLLVHIRGIMRQESEGSLPAESRGCQKQDGNAQHRT